MRPGVAIGFNRFECRSAIGRKLRFVRTGALQQSPAAGSDAGAMDAEIGLAQVADSLTISATGHAGRV